MRAVFFGTYNRGHSANRIAAAAVRAAGCEVVEIHEALWERTRDKDAGYFSPLSLVKLFFEWMRASWRLARTWRRSGGAAVAVVGFNGQLDVLLLRLLGLRYGPRIVFAPLVSLTETLVEDRGVYREGSLAARLLLALDRLSCRAADVVVVDTEEHRRYFVEVLGIEASRLLVCPLGADPELFLPELPASKHRGETERLEVLYFGQYLPLHGLDVIVDAVGRLALRDDFGRRLRFTFIGTGEERARVEPVLRATRAELSFIDWVAYEELAARIAKADIVLGIFGSSRKARMVVPNKVWEAAAVGRAIVSADTPALREFFEDGRELLLCRADGAALADAIATLADAREGAARRKALGEAARRRMLEAFSLEALGRCWSVALRGPLALAADAAPRIGVAVLCFQDARRTLACLHSVAADGYPALDILAVDNASTEGTRRELEEGIASIGAFRTAGTGGAAKELDVELLTLERNLGYAGANNLAMTKLFSRGCEAVFILNSDTIVAPGSIGALVAAWQQQRKAGPFGPRVSDGRPGCEPLSLGERYRAALLWAPRSLLRVRSRRQRPYFVSGVTGCALFVPRTVHEAVGGFDEKLFAYYEEVDLCLRAREAGFRSVVVPEADVGHEGARGFLGGMTPLAAWLKARNLGLVALARLHGISRLVFLAGYAALIGASSLAYTLRGRGDVASAMLAGFGAGLRGEGGEPPRDLFARSGYAASGLETRG